MRGRLLNLVTAPWLLLCVAAVAALRLPGCAPPADYPPLGRYEPEDQPPGATWYAGAGDVQVVDVPGATHRVALRFPVATEGAGQEVLFEYLFAGLRRTEARAVPPTLAGRTFSPGGVQILLPQVSGGTLVYTNVGPITLAGDRPNRLSVTTFRKLGDR